MATLDHFFNDNLDGANLIDLSQIALATVMHTYEPGTKFTVEMIRKLILSTIKHNALKFKAEGFKHTVIAIDNAKYGYWRRQEEDYYKRNRAIGREEAIEKESFDWEGYFAALGVVIQELKDYMPYYVIDVRHCEADDVIAVLTKYFSLKGWKVRIISSDGDFTQLHKYDNVTQYSPMQKKFVKVKTSCPAEDCLTKVVKGDRKDCVASIKVRGDFWLTYDSENERTPPTKADFVQSLLGKTDDEIYEILRAEISKKTYHKKTGIEAGIKLLNLQGVDTLNEQFDEVEVITDKLAEIQMHRFKRNRVLIDFDYIRDDIAQSILDAYENYKPAPRGKMHSYFIKSGLASLLPDINNF